MFSLSNLPNPVVWAKGLYARLPAIRRSVFNFDYSYPTRFAPALWGIAAPAEFFYYWFESSKGYWDSLPLRAVLFRALAALALVDWKKPKPAWRIIQWEITL